MLSLQNAGDVESTLSILNVLDELLSAGKLRSALDHLTAYINMVKSFRGLTVVSRNKFRESVKVVCPNKPAVTKRTEEGGC